MTTDTQDGIVQVYRIYINAPAERVWQAITDPEWTQRYGYSGRGVFELVPGGKYTAYSCPKMLEGGAPEIAIDGEVILAETNKKLVQTFRMLMDDNMTKEGFTTLTYELEETFSGATKLTLTHELGNAEQLANVVSGKYEDGGAGGGWSWVLSDMKSVIETGKSFSHFVN